MKSHPSLINEESKQIWKAVLFAPERCNLYNQKNMNPECPRPWAYRPQCLSELLNVHIFYIQYILTNTRIRSPPRARPSCRRENVTAHCPRKKLEAGEQVPDQEQRLRHQAAVAEPEIGQKPLVVTSSWESALPLGKRMRNQNKSLNTPSYKVETINPSFLSTHMRGLKARSFTYYTISA